MTEPDFRGGADRNPQLFGVNLDCKPTLGADLSSETGRRRKSGGAYAPSAPPRWAPLIIFLMIKELIMTLKPNFWDSTRQIIFFSNQNPSAVCFEIHFKCFEKFPEGFASEVNEMENELNLVVKIRASLAVPLRKPIELINVS